MAGSAQLNTFSEIGDRNTAYDSAARSERALLGAVLLKGELWPEIATLKASDFSLDSHRRIFARMVDLATSSRPIELTTLVNELASHGELEAIGDVGYVSALLDGLPDRPLKSIEHHVHDVRKYAGLRHIAAAADSLREAAQDPSATVPSLRGRLLQALHDLTSYETQRRIRITKLEELPDPCSCGSEPVEWILHGLIPRRGVTVVAGEAGAGKTWLALALAHAVSMGGDFLGRRTTTADVLYLDRENPLSLIKERLEIVRGRGRAPRHWGLWCPDEPPMIGDPRLMEFARKGPVLIIDSMIRFHVADENSATQMAPVMASLRELATVGASVIVLHHKPKSETSSYRGSSDIVAGADAAFALVKKRDGLLELRTIKNRFAVDTTVEIKQNFASGTFAVVGTPELEFATELDHLANIIRSSPGLTQNQIIKQCGIQRLLTSSILTGRTL
jgi:hypothetical protein